MQDWLIVVDMQPGFGHADSPWAAPGYDACAETISRLLPLFGPQVIFTRFVPPTDPEGAWRPYYDQWPFATAAENAWMWALDARFAGHEVSSPRFAKWQELREVLPEEARLTVCGVATDCCVLGTAIEAVDDGRHVRLVTDACAAGSGALHDAALAVMADRAPMLTLTDSAALLAGGQ